MMGLMAIATQAQRVIDRLDRGLVAIPMGDKTGVGEYGPSGQGMFVSWRKLPADYYDTQYNLYRNGTKVNAEPLSVSNYQDRGGTTASTYSVVPVVNGQERTDLASAEVASWSHQYWDIPMKPVVNRAGATVTSRYSLNDCSVADVDGDGQMEIVVKRRNDSGLLNQGNTTTFNRHECYKLDGTLLWYIDMGPNLMAGPDEQFDLILFDWDEDGRAEALMRGADNMIIHTASGKDIKIGDMDYYAPRDEYTKEGAEYLLYMDGATGEPYGWDGSDNWTPQAYPLPRFEQGESNYGTVWGSNDTGHRATKHYFGAPYLDGVHASIFLGRGCYTRHKFCALDVDPSSHTLTQRWRWNCYDPSSPWFGNGFHNFSIADVDMDGRDEIVFGSMFIDDTGYGLSTTGYGHGDAQHCGDFDPYSWGMEDFVCLESSAVPGICYTDATTSTVRYSTGSGADQGRCLAGNFLPDYPGAIGITYGIDVVSLVADRVITGVNLSSDDYMNMRVYWDGDLNDEFMDSPGVEREVCIYKYGAGRPFMTSGCALNNSSKNNPCFLGDIIGDWREEIIARSSDNQHLRIYTSNYASDYAVTTLWADHEYRNAMVWQSVGYNQPPHPSFFLGELEGITKEPPALTVEGRTETSSVYTTDEHLLVSGYEDKTVSVADGAAPWVLTVNAPAWVQGSGAQQAVASTPKQPSRTINIYTTTFTGGALGGTTHLVKQGEGVLVLNNATHKHTGGTDVWQGTLQFDGTLESSPLWLNRHTTLISNGGQFLGGLKADYNATISPGGQDQVGTVTASTLTLGFGARVVLDIKGTECDRLNATTLVIETKDWEYGPKYKAPVLQFNGSNIGEGVYVLGTVGTVEGNLSDIILEGLSNDVTSSLRLSNGTLQLVIGDMREAGTVVWNGSESNSIWEQATGTNFLFNGESTYSANGDDIVFDDNAASTDVVIKGLVSPHSVTFNNETKAYTLSGDSIVGGAPIVKNGKGRVTINNWNVTGATTVNGGTLSVSMLANNNGQFYGSLGTASQSITLNDGSTLQTNGTIFTHQQLNVNGEVTIDVPTSKSVDFFKGIHGDGATVTKTGAGSMEMATDNTFSKLVIKAGSVTSNHNSNIVDQLPPTVEFQGGTLWAANRESTPYLTNKANFVVEKNKQGTFYAAFGGTYTGSLTGGGTFNVYTGGIRCYFDGDWSEFTGTINAGKNNRQTKKSYDPVWAFRNTKGLPKATLNVAENVRVSNEGKTLTVGKVTGKGALVGDGTWIICNDENYTLATEIGITSDRTDPYGGTIAKSSTKLIKRGAGKMMINSVGNIYATLTVEEGTVSFDDKQLSTNLTGGLGTIVREGGRIVGQGLLSGLTLQSGSELMPCDSYILETLPGTIKTNARLTANSGAVVNFLFGSAKQSQLQCASMTMNGTVKVTLLNGYTPKAGDEFTLWTVSGSYAGTPQFDLPALPEGLYWDVSGVADKNGVLRVSEDQAGIGAIAANAEVYCEVYTPGGTKVAALQTAKANAVVQLQKQYLPAGTYIVKMRDGRRSETHKMVVK